MQRQKRDSAGFIVDLASMAHALDSLMRQPLHSRLRFLFDLHDLDGDSFLKRSELKAIMDSLLEMFQSKPNTRQEHNEEQFLYAVSSFLSASLKMAKKRDDMETTEDDGYRLSFNEFLLAILSQSVFVEYFERQWKIMKDSAGLIYLEWRKGN